METGEEARREAKQAREKDQIHTHQVHKIHLPHARPPVQAVGVVERVARVVGERVAVGEGCAACAVGHWVGRRGVGVMYPEVSKMVMAGSWCCI